MKHFVLAVLWVLAALPLHLAAQAPLPQIDPKPKAGDCALTVKLPAGVNPDTVVITLDDAGAPIRFTLLQRSPLVAALKQPLPGNSDVTVTAGSASTKERVASAPAGSVIPSACPGSGTAARVFDEREVFEASGFLGAVFDNFAPAIDGNYVNPAAATERRSRLTAGVESQYRLVGTKNQPVQLWLTGYVLNGMRTADASCKDTETNAACLTEEAQNPAGSFNYIISHASTIEAHVDARLELLDLQADTDVPAKFYVYARAGFLDLENAPRVYDANSVGAGLLAPKGVFRNSYAQVGWGNSHQYQTDQKFDRLKINGVLMFDVIPGLSADSITKKLGAAWRFFLAISIDRNLHNGPDAVQSYIGFDFDLRRVFGTF